MFSSVFSCSDGRVRGITAFFCYHLQGLVFSCISLRKFRFSDIKIATVSLDKEVVIAKICICYLGNQTIFYFCRRNLKRLKMSEKNTAADCGRPPRTPKQTTQHLICAVILKFLYHGLRILYRYDDRVRRDLDRIDTGTVIQLSCSSRGPSLKVISEEKALTVCSDRNLFPDIEIRFKDLSFAFAVFTGQTGIAESFSKHMMYVNGDFSKIMSLVRCMEQAERYLFPSFITRRILKTLLPKKISSIRLYMSIFRSMLLR